MGSVRLIVLSNLGDDNDRKNALISKVLVHLQQIDLKLEVTETDMLGDAYEYLIGQFACYSKLE